MSSEPHRNISVAVIGFGSHGKSSLVNSIRDIYNAADPKRASVHLPGSMPHKKQEYEVLLPLNGAGVHPVDGDGDASCVLTIADVPGAGHRQTPLVNYIADYQLHLYDHFFLVITNVLQEESIAIAQALVSMGKSFWFVCPKIDQDISNAMADDMFEEEEKFVKEFRQELCVQLGKMFEAQLFIVSNRAKHRGDFDMPAFLDAIDGLRHPGSLPVTKAAAIVEPPQIVLNNSSIPHELRKALPSRRSNSGSNRGNSRRRNNPKFPFYGWQAVAQWASVAILITLVAYKTGALQALYGFLKKRVGYGPRQIEAPPLPPSTVPRPTIGPAPEVDIPTVVPMPTPAPAPPVTPEAVPSPKIVQDPASLPDGPEDVSRFRKWIQEFFAPNQPTTPPAQVGSAVESTVPKVATAAPPPATIAAEDVPAPTIGDEVANPQDAAEDVSRLDKLWRRVREVLGPNQPTAPPAPAGSGDGSTATTSEKFEPPADSALTSADTTATTAANDAPAATTSVTGSDATGSSSQDSS